MLNENFTTHPKENKRTPFCFGGIYDLAVLYFNCRADPRF